MIVSSTKTRFVTALDSQAQIGLEYRFGIVPNGEIGIRRTSDKTIELFCEYGQAEG
jgi:hypothetical protein